MINSITIGSTTMAAGSGIEGSTIRWALKNVYSKFKRVVVVDGDLTEEAKSFYSQFDNVQVIDSPWRDSYVAQYQRFADELKDDEWAIWMDCDEFPSQPLINIFKTWNPNDNDDIFRIPCVLYLTEDGTHYYSAEPTPNKEFIGQWTKSVIFKKNSGLYFDYGGSHVFPRNKSNKEVKYIPEPYHHMKSLQSFVKNDVYQGYLYPPGQGYSQIETAKFKVLTSQYKTTKDFKKATKEGAWSPPLKKFAWDNRREYSRPISRLAWTYFILYGHKMPTEDEFMTWDNVKQYVLSPETMKIYNESKNNNNVIVVE